ncbi:hypothetical protein [Parerythrobacter aestuarii]|uniref:hypothetical protein n=1 Tax=Parerythrobacter aestuarii TaxID=3020909 RepID=UPI0024DE072D|nr:hypothetical protein [Parerythrobacter aestuarii]
MRAIFGAIALGLALYGCNGREQTGESRPEATAEFPQSFAYNCDPGNGPAPALGAPWLPGQEGYLPLEWASVDAALEKNDPVLAATVQQCMFYDFMWRSFIAVNWPAVPGGNRGQPDRGKTIFGGIGTLPLAVWETYKTPQQIFTSSDRWEDPDVANWGNSPTDTSRAFLAFPDQLTDYRPDVQQPYFFGQSTGPLIDQNGNYVRYEVAVNQAFFTYIRKFGYYNAGRQRDAVLTYIANPKAADAFQRPPFGNPAQTTGDGYLAGLPDYARQGMVDVKAAWKELPEGAPYNNRYLQRRIAVDAQGTTKLYGLVALHILRYTPNKYDPSKGVEGAFVAATFEHVDNVAIDFEKPLGGTLTPSFNPGGGPQTPEEEAYGFAGRIPPCPEADRSPGQAPCSSGTTTNPSRKPVNIYRVTPLSDAIEAINDHYQKTVLGSSVGGNRSVMRFYRLIGTQNRHQGPFAFDTPGERNLNGHQGPITGVYTNTNNLINAALESYTQKNFSCILCHAAAKPKCTPEKAFEEDQFKTLTFLLNAAQFKPGDSCTP